MSCTTWPFSTKASSRSPSGLSLAAEQGIQVEVSSMDPGIVQDALCGRRRRMDLGLVQVGLVRGACSEWASRLSLAAEQSIEVGSTSMDVVLQVALFRIKACSEWASGLSLAAEQSIGWSQEAWIEVCYELHSFEEGPVQSGQVGFPLLLNKALAEVKKHGLDICTSWILWGHVQSGRVGFPLLLNKALIGGKRHGLDVCTRWTLWGHVRSGQVGFPLLRNKALADVKKHGLDVCAGWTLWGHVQSGQVGFPCC